MDENQIEGNLSTSRARENASPVWDMSQERAFIETLLNQRFNYFLIFYSLIFVGFVNSKNPLLGETILIFGSIISIFFILVLYRTHNKLDKILEVLSQDNTHPVSIIDNLVGGVSRRKHIGKTIPTICCIFLWTSCLVNLGYMICQKLYQFKGC